MRYRYLQQWEDSMNINIDSMDLFFRLTAAFNVAKMPIQCVKSVLLLPLREAKRSSEHDLSSFARVNFTKRLPSP